MLSAAVGWNFPFLLLALAERAVDWLARGAPHIWCSLSPACVYNLAITYLACHLPANLSRFGPTTRSWEEAHYGFWENRRRMPPLSPGRGNARLQLVVQQSISVFTCICIARPSDHNSIINFNQQALRLASESRCCSN